MPAVPTAVRLVTRERGDRCAEEPDVRGRGTRRAVCSADGAEFSADIHGGGFCLPTNLLRTGEAMIDCIKDAAEVLTASETCRATLAAACVCLPIASLTTAFAEADARLLVTVGTPKVEGAPAVPCAMEATALERAVTADTTVDAAAVPELMMRCHLLSQRSTSVLALIQFQPGGQTTGRPARCASTKALMSLGSTSLPTSSSGVG